MTDPAQQTARTPSSDEWQVDGEPILSDEGNDPAPIPIQPSLPRPSPAPASESINPVQIVEAMLFVGGTPLTAVIACAAIRGLTPAAFGEIVESITRRYREQNRPYTILPRDGGYALTLLPAYARLRERLFRGPRITRLNQAALDCLAVVAYRQPTTKTDVDTVRGVESGSVMRQLIRLGLITVCQRAVIDSSGVQYGTTARFLQVFGLTSLDDLPRLGETEEL